MSQARLKNGKGPLTAKKYGVLISPIWVLYADTIAIVIEVAVYALVKFLAHLSSPFTVVYDRMDISCAKPRAMTENGGQVLSRDFRYGPIFPSL